MSKHSYRIFNKTENSNTVRTRKYLSHTSRKRTSKDVKSTRAANIYRKEKGKANHNSCSSCESWDNYQIS